MPMMFRLPAMKGPQKRRLPEEEREEPQAKKHRESEDIQGPHEGSSSQIHNQEGSNRPCETSSSETGSESFIGRLSGLDHCEDLSSEEIPRTTSMESWHKSSKHVTHQETDSSSLRERRQSWNVRISVQSCEKFQPMSFSENIIYKQYLL